MNICVCNHECISVCINEYSSVNMCSVLVCVCVCLDLVCIYVILSLSISVYIISLIHSVCVYVVCMCELGTLVNVYV